MKFVIVNLLVAVAFFHECNGQFGDLKNQYGLASPLQLYAGATDAANCTSRSGNICGTNIADCNSIFLCIPNMPDPIKAACQDGLTCNAGVCSTVKSPLCEYGTRTFICNTPGMYPEPSACNKYNFCVPGTGTPPPVPTLTTATCEDGWGYNPATASCDKPLLNNACGAADRPVPPCTITGQSGALKGNPSMYYICMPYSSSDVSLYPNIFKCPRNTKYVGNYNCR